MGSPKFAADVLAGIIEHHEVVCVVTQPDAAAGRGHQMRFNPVKQFAVEHNIPVLQPEKISKEAHLLQDYPADIIVTCAFGQILKQSVLDAAPYGVINVHGSLLPRYRGAAPVQWSVINGDKETGVTILQTELGLDSGPMIYSLPMQIEPTATAGEVLRAMVPVGVQALLTALAQIEKGVAQFIPQEESEATVAPMLSKEMARIDWSKSAVDLMNLVRGLNPWPVAYFKINNEVVKVYQATALEGEAVAGKVVHSNARDGLIIGCGHGLLRIDILQVAGKKVVAGKDFCNGRDLSSMEVE